MKAFLVGDGLYRASLADGTVGRFTGEIALQRVSGDASRRAEKLQAVELERYFQKACFRFPLRENACFAQRVAAYSLLRHLLESHIGYGRPLSSRFGFVSVDGRGAWVSVSYTVGFAMAGLCNHPIGVDVQKVRSLPGGVFDELASADERVAFGEESAGSQVQLFSLKESYEKARNGRGMVWPANYACYDDEFSLVDEYGAKALCSERIAIELTDWVASVTVLDESYAA